VTEAAGYQERLSRVRGRLEEHHRRHTAGLTPADATTGERWDEGQLWAHLSEFIPYWIDQVDGVLSGSGPVPFGRTKSDPHRVSTIEERRHTPSADLWATLEADINRLDRWLSALPEAAWRARGVHPTLGEMDLRRILDEFLVGHLEEHADQLDQLNRHQA
jgi:hypothetical protein